MVFHFRLSWNPFIKFNKNPELDYEALFFCLSNPARSPLFPLKDAVKPGVLTPGNLICNHQPTNPVYI